MKRELSSLRFLLVSAALTLLANTAANASLTLLKPDPVVPATFVGQGGYSADGLGQNGTGGTIQADVPAGSTVVQAYLYGTYYFTFDPTLAERTIDFDGTPVELTKIAEVGTFGLATARADVTTQVAAKVGAGGGITDFAINNDPGSLDGVALVVIYSNPASPLLTIAVLDGGASQTGDTATFTFAAPLDKTVPGFSAVMSLGSGFSYQLVPGHTCGGVQFSIVNVNGSLLTNCAGNFDDGVGNNGALITVGGVGDSTNNPTPPDAPAEDDELYDLDPFLAQGDTSIQIATSNPSQDDNLFLAIIAITAEAAVTTEICDDGIDNDGDGLIDAADPDCIQPPQPEICDDGVDNDGDGLVDHEDPDCATADTKRMTGGGTIKAGKVHAGFTLSCDTTTPGKPHHLEVNWGKGNKFHLEQMGTASCSDDPGISESKPVAGFDTYSGNGTGRYNGVSGATAEWIFTDAGEPGKNDMLKIKITDAGGDVVLDMNSTIDGGNHQAHP